MPAKRRISKRRRAPGVELAAWREKFVTGCDLFCDLEALGFNREPTEEETHQAWQHFGAAFLASYEGKEKPWAAETFGPPASGKRSGESEDAR